MADLFDNPLALMKMLGGMANTAVKETARTGRRAVGKAADVAMDVLSNRNIQDILNATGPGGGVDDILNLGFKGLKSLSHMDDIGPTLGIVAPATFNRYFEELMSTRKIKPGDVDIPIAESIRRTARGYRPVRDNPALLDEMITRGQSVVEDALNNPNVKAPSGMDEYEWLRQLGQDEVRNAVGRSGIRRLDDIADDVAAVTDDAPSPLENLAGATVSVEDAMIASQSHDAARSGRVDDALSLMSSILNPRVQATVAAQERRINDPKSLMEVMTEFGQPVGLTTAKDMLRANINRQWLSPIADPILRKQALSELNPKQLSERAASLRRLIGEGRAEPIKGSRLEGRTAYRPIVDIKKTAASMAKDGVIKPEEVAIVDSLFKPRVKFSNVVRKVDPSLSVDTMVRLNELMDKTLFRLKGNK